MPASSPVKRAAACLALLNTKLEVRNSASECSWNSVRAIPARTPLVAISYGLAIKKPGPLCSGPGSPRHALAGFITRPQAVAPQIGAKPNYIRPPISREGRRLRGQIQVQLGGLVLAGVAFGVAPDLDRAQVVGGDVAGDVVPVEAGGLEAAEPGVAAPHRVLER